MPRPAQVDARAGAPPPTDGPRFALRFEDGAGRLVLARPLKFALGEVDELELELGPLRFPLDLTAGPGRFRTRRTRVRSARVRIDLPSMLARFVEEPFALEPIVPIDGGMAFALRDAFGTLALDVHARFEGSRLWVLPTRARAVHEGPAPALVRAVVAARAVGMALDDTRGALVADRVLSHVLMEALVPHGWRMPDDRGVRLDVEVLGARRVALRTVETDHDPSLRRGPWEQARMLAPVVAQLTLGDEERAAREWASVRERHPQVDGSALGFGEPREDGPPRRCLELREALHRGDVDAAARCADRLEAVEPSDAVAVDGLVAAADRAMATRPTLASRLLERACARRPSDPRNALRLIEASARLGDAAELARVIEAGLTMREPGPDRGAFARDAAAVCELAGAVDASERLWQLAEASLPDDPRVLEGLARRRRRANDLAGAQGGYDRAASAWADEGDRESEAKALCAAASLATARDDHAAAEVRLTRAARLRDEPSIWAALANARHALGRTKTALRAEDRLLEAAQRTAAPTPDVLEGLERGARGALQRAQLERAKTWRAALTRAGAPDERVATLQTSIAQAELAERASDPAQLFALEPAECLDVLDRIDAPAPFLAEALAACEQLGAALEVLRDRLGGDLGPTIGEAVVARIDEVEDGSILLALAPRLADEERAALLDAARARFEAAGDAAGAARALARLGVLKRDTTMLRAALSAAEREGAAEIAREIVDLALGVVGGGPARKALEAVRKRLERD